MTVVPIMVEMSEQSGPQKYEAEQQRPREQESGMALSHQEHKSRGWRSTAAGECPVLPAGRPPTCGLEGKCFLSPPWVQGHFQPGASQTQ